VNLHIPSKYTKEMSAKSDVVSTFLFIYGTAILTSVGSPWSPTEEREQDPGNV